MVTLALVIRQLLLDLAICQDDSQADWFVTITYLPDNAQVRDNIVAVTDTEGNKDGRIMATGETIIHPGCQIRVRSTDYMTGQQKIKQIQTAFDKVHNYVTEIEGVIAHIQTISQQGGIMPMGMDSTGRRYHFSLNYIATVKYTKNEN
jgi:hypothetical protein